jgi:hypothetical protein
LYFVDGYSGQIFNVDLNYPYNITGTTGYTGYVVYGASQVPSCLDVSLILPTPTPTPTPTNTPTPTVTPTNTITPTVTVTPTITSTNLVRVKINAGGFREINNNGNVLTTQIITGLPFDTVQMRTYFGGPPVLTPNDVYVNGTIVSFIPGNYYDYSINLDSLGSGSTTVRFSGNSGNIYGAIVTRTQIMSSALGSPIGSPSYADQGKNVVPPSLISVGEFAGDSSLYITSGSSCTNYTGQTFYVVSGCPTNAISLLAIGNRLLNNITLLPIVGGNNWVTLSSTFFSGNTKKTLQIDNNGYVIAVENCP